MNFENNHYSGSIIENNNGDNGIQGTIIVGNDVIGHK
jgi:hypothetical protein